MEEGRPDTPLQESGACSEEVGSSAGGRGDLFTSMNKPPSSSSASGDSGQGRGDLARPLDEDLLEGGPTGPAAGVASFDTMYVKAAGEVLADARRHGVVYTAEGRLRGKPERRDVLRESSRTWSDVKKHLEGLDWCPAEVAEAAQLARLLASERKLKKLRVSPWAWRLWLKGVEEIGSDMQPEEAIELLATCRWEEGKELAERQPGMCGTRTAEHSGQVQSTGEWVSWVWCLRCGGWRCCHCARVVRGAAAAARASLGWEEARVNGQWLWFVTFTVDWNAFFKAQGIAHWNVDALRAVAWSQIPKMWDWLISRDLVREGLRPVAMWARKSEAHRSGFPHCHGLFACCDHPNEADDFGSIALREAGVANTDELLAVMDVWHAHPEYKRRLSVYNEADEAWEAGGRKGRRPRRPHHPCRLPFSKARQQLIRAAHRSGFGHVDARPIDPRTFGTKHDPFLYFAKPFFGMEQWTNIPDAGRVLLGASQEFAKATQIPNALPRGVRIVGYSRSWPKLSSADPEDRLDPETSTFAIHHVSVVDMLALVHARGWSVSNKVLQLNFHDPIPERGERRTAVLESFVVRGAPGGLTLADDGLVPPTFTPPDQGESDDQLLGPPPRVLGGASSGRLQGGEGSRGPP